jgi:uncharacterized protein
VQNSFFISEFHTLFSIWMEILGYCAAVLIGVSLGLIGGGGSILTVPVLVYLMRVDPVSATAYSLFIVGATALVGGIQKYIQGTVNTRAVIFFGIPSILAVFVTRLWVVPAIPEIMYQSGNLKLTKDIFIMVLFAILMVAAAFSMIYQGRISTKKPDPEEPAFNYPLIFLEGVVVGALTGLVGAGGGFLIIPALVLLTRLPMKVAVGTSLMVIAAKSLIGFTGDLAHMNMDWSMLIIFTGLAIAGIFVGNRLSHGIDNARLKQAFGWFILVMGIYILLKESVLRN